MPFTPRFGFSIWVQKGGGLQQLMGRLRALSAATGSGVRVILPI